MSAAQHDQEQHCPQCDNHCPVDALQCGRGRKYFGIGGEEHGHDPRPDGSLSGLLQQCGRFIHHGARDLGEQELFQALGDEEQAALRAALEKLSADWQQRFGGDSRGHGSHGHGGHGGEHHHKHEGRGQ